VIDEGLGSPWPDEVTDAAQRFRQGHLIERPPLFYFADLSRPIWDLSAAAAEGLDEEDARQLVELDPEQRPPYGVLTSQDCDVTEEGRPNPAQPWVQVAPVYAVESDDRLRERDFIISLDPPALDGGPWVADLRIELPLEKGVLVDRTPIDGFASEVAYYRFADQLARRRGRPALAAVFHEVISMTFREVKQQSSSWKKKTKRVRDHVYKLLLAIQEGTRLDPAAAQLCVVVDGQPDEETQEWFGEWFDRARLVADEHGLKLLPVSWINRRSVDLVRYDDLVEIDNPMYG
jgi:hypothetical protein